MEIVKADSIAFAYTVKTLGTTDVTKTAYDPFFKRLDHFLIKVEYQIAEKDSKGKLHYHGILYLPKGFFRKRIMVNGFHVKLVELYDRKGWLKYIHKDCMYQHFEEQAEAMDAVSDTDTVISVGSPPSIVRDDFDHNRLTKKLFK